MCLIEYPTWAAEPGPLRQPDLADYTSVRDFHDSLAAGVEELRERVRGNHRQVGDLRISEGREPGYEQITRLLELVREQGEGAGAGIHDDPEPSHFATLNELRDGLLPDTFSGDANPSAGSDGARAQAEFAAVVERTFTAWERAFAGEDSGELGLAQIIDAARACWEAGAVPKFD
jgi:hypothetical protein